MATFHLDLVNGNDSNDGSTWALAKKLLSAYTAVVAGDIIKVAKTTETALTGTLTFTDGSTSVATSADLTGSLAANDFIAVHQNGSSGWWEVASLNSTTITLTTAYRGATQTNVTAYKMVPFDFNATASTTDAQTAPSGRNWAHLSGGWDTGSDTRTGFTHIRNTNSTRQGRGWNLGSNFAGEISFLGAWRCGSGNGIPWTNTGTGRLIHDIQAGFCAGGPLGVSAFPTAQSYNLVIVQHTGNGITAGSSSPRGMNLKDSLIIVNSTGNAIDNDVLRNWQIIENCTFRGGTQGTGIQVACYSHIIDCVVRGFDRGIEFSGNDSIVSGCDLADANTADLFWLGSSSVPLNGRVLIANTTYETIGPTANIVGQSNEHQHVDIMIDADQGSAGVWRRYHRGHITESNTSDARSGTCVKMIPKYAATVSDDKWHEMTWPIPSESSVTRTVSAYIKKDGSWNGTVQRMELRQYGIVVDTQVLTLTTSYVQYDVSFVGTADEGIELVVICDGTAGAIYIDDVTWT